MPETAVLEHSGDGATDSVELGSQSATVAQTRRIVTQYLGRRCPWADCGAVVLVLSELLANAVRHADGWWRLRVTGDDTRLVIEVRDRSQQQPRLLTPDLDNATGGLGMHIVTKLANGLQVEHAPGAGKVVRATWLRSRSDLGRDGGATRGPGTVDGSLKASR